MSVSLSTENLVDQIAAKPSIANLIHLVGIMSSQIMMVMVMFFPNFGGYIPYTEWRCNRTSVICYERVIEFQPQGQYQLLNYSTKDIDCERGYRGGVEG